MSVREQNKGRRNILLGQDGNALITLIIVNAVVFVLAKFLHVVYNIGNLDESKFFQNIFNWFVVPASPDKLFTRPWSILTYMFTDIDVFSLIANMLWLWWFGYILQDLTGNKKIGPLYVYGGVAGAVFFLLAANIFPSVHQYIDVISPLKGAGAAVMAIAVATTMLAPDYRIFPMLNGGIPIWVLTLVYVLIDFATIADGPQRAAVSIGHLAAAGMGLIYVRRLRTGHDMGDWMHRFYNWFFTMFEPKSKNVEQQSPQRKMKSEVFYETKGQQPFRKTSNITQQKIDEILDKIGKEGYHFLTDEEKEYLKRASQDL
jgi:membrane associated rhomboid family serine protease